MICPIMTGDPLLDESRTGGKVNCRCDECAWWEILQEKCAVTVIAIALDNNARSVYIRMED